MSASRVPVDDQDVLQHILTDTDTLLLDFDGPVCSVFANFPAPVVANHLREILTEDDHTDLPPEVEKADDPFDVFKYAAQLGDGEAGYIEAALRAYEVEAVATALPTPGAHELVARWSAAGRKLAIVSNNSAAAVETYLHQHRLIDHVVAVIGRTSSDPTLLKPHPHLVVTAMNETATPADRCTFVGDSESDMLAARAAGIKAIGYANKAGKVERLSEAGAVIVLMELFPSGLL